MANTNKLSRLKKRAKRELIFGPQVLISFISIDRREETLECGHVLIDQLMSDPNYVKFYPMPRFRRCIMCKGKGKPIINET